MTGDNMIYNSRSQQMLGTNIVDTYARYLPQQAPISMTTVAIIGGSLALIAVVIVVKQIKSKKSGFAKSYAGTKRKK